MRLIVALLLAGGCADGDAQDETGTADDTGGGDTAEDRCSGGAGWQEGGRLVEADGLSAFLLVPADVPACAPLVVFLHGGDNPGPWVEGDWIDLLDTGLAMDAGARGFALLVPGVEEGEEVTHGWSLEAAEQVDALIDAVQAGVDLDRDRTWLIGQSAGGHVATYMGLYDPGRISGVGAVSAGIGSYFDYPETEPDPKLPFYVAHDPDDAVVPYSLSEDLAAALDEHGHTCTFEDWDLGGNGHAWNAALTPAVLDWLAAQS